MAHFDAYIKGKFYQDADTLEDLIKKIADHAAEPYAWGSPYSSPPEASDVMYYDDEGEEDVFSQQRLRTFNIMLETAFNEAVRDIRERE